MSNQKHKYITPKTIIKLLSIIAFLFIFFALMIISTTPPAKGYEISIYDAYPLYFWFFLILSIVIGQIIILINIFDKNTKKDNVWFIGLLIVLVALSTILILLYSRDYAIFGRADHLTHIGEAKNILFTGFSKSSNYYPNIHILSTVISQIAHIDIIDVSNFLPHLFLFFFFFAFIIFSRYFFVDYNEFLFSIVLFSSVLFFGENGTYLAQYNQSFLLIALILFLYFKRSMVGNTIPFEILFIILSVSLVFLHPLTFLLIMIIFLMSVISIFISQKNKKNNQNANNVNPEPEKKKVLMPILLLAIVFLAWYFSFSTIINNFIEVFSSIFYGTGESFLLNQLSRVTKYNVMLYDLLRIGVFTYGRAIIIGFLSFFSMLYLFYHFIRKKDNHLSQYKIIFLSLCIVVFSSLAFLAYIFDFIVGWGRFFLFASFFSLMLVSLVLSFLFKNRYKLLKKKISYYKFPIFFITIFLMLFLSVFTFYFSPLKDHPNYVVSSGECIGFNWFIEYRNTTYFTDELGIAQYRFYAALYKNNSDSTNLRSRDTNPPDHFGYNHFAYLGMKYNASNYLLLSTLGRIVFPSMYSNYKDYWLFTEKDFARLLDDSTVISVYSNSELDVFLINSR